MWGVLAHEQAHVYLGEGCRNEKKADLLALDAMWEVEEYRAWIDWYTFLVEVKGWEY
jgi:hypothetical protein